MPNAESEPNRDIFLLVLKALDQAGALKELVLIGSWCLLLYRKHFGTDAPIPAVRTTDMDLLVLHPKKLMPPADIPQALAAVGFLEEIAWATGYCKYRREEFVVEFLAPLRGDGRNQVEHVTPLNITVQGLRHLGYREEELMSIVYQGFTLRVPRPELYTLFKFIVHEQRKNPAKKEKDLQTAQQMTYFLMDREEGRVGMAWAFNRLTRKEQKAILRITANKAPMLHTHLQEQNSRFLV